MKRMRKAIFFFSLLALFFCFIAASFAYESIPFKNGGSIEGGVEYTGATVPADPMLSLSSETEYCGQSMPARKYLIKNGKIQNVIVYIVDIKSGKALPGEPVNVTSLKCEFLPHVSVGFKGKKIIMKTEDPVFHIFDVHASICGKEVYHVALPEKGSSVTKTLAQAGLLKLSCYVHPWQHAYVYIFNHPYAVITDEMGKFIIKDIPSGTYSVEAWHEALGIRKISNVKIESGKTSIIKLEYTSEISSEEKGGV
jgi:hypothetical protein